MNQTDRNLLASLGIYPSPQTQGVIRSDGGNIGAIAADAALLPNAAVPAEFSLYLDQNVVDILKAPHKATELLPEASPAGINETTSHYKFAVADSAGYTVPYDDYANHGSTDVNFNYLTREQYVFQTTIAYGQLETQLLSAAKINLVSERQKVAARLIQQDLNRFYFYGVQGREIYGLLNDPNLPAAVAPQPAPRPSAAAAVGWAVKTAKEIFEDVLYLFQQLRVNSAGLITETDPLILALPNQQMGALAKLSDYNVSVRQTLKEYFGNLKIVGVPELKAPGGPGSEERVFLFAPQFGGNRAGELVFGQKFKQLELVRDLSAYRQKVYASTFGAIIKYPVAFAIMSGVEAAA
jgi:hypothetical protein